MIKYKSLEYIKGAQVVMNDRYTAVISEQSVSLAAEIAKCIKDNFNDIEIVQVFKNGTEITSFLKNRAVDIVICSADGTYGSGISVAKYIRSHKLDTEVILTTNHKQFETAKQAIDYNVSDLLVKPLYPQELIDSIKNAKRIIKDKVKRANTESELYLLQWEWKQQNLALAYNFVISLDLLLSKKKPFFKSKTLDLLKCDKVTVKVLNFLPYIKNVWKNQRELFYKAIKDLGEGETEAFSAFQVSNKDDTIEYIIVSEQSGNIAYEFAENLKKSVKNLYNADLKLKIGKYQNIGDLLKSKLNGNLVNDYIEALSNDNSEKAAEIAKIISKEEDFDRIQKVLEELNERLLDDYDIDIEFCKERLNNSNISEALIEALKKAEVCLSADRYLVVGIKDYIRRNFNSNITVEAIAQAFSMSASYIGRAFKEETGQKLIDYLVDVKFEKAKELLATGNYAVKDVVHLVGYSQVKYFGQVFKKRIGVTPSEFIKRVKQDKNI